MTDGLNDRYDVVVIGGGAAGLSAGLMLARARRSVAVIDAGEPRNAPAAAVHGLFAREGTPPAELLERGRGEVRQFGGHVVAGTVASAKRGEDGFTVALEDGREARARRLLVTTGVVDRLPDIPGLAEHWGEGVVHCPYCHGWEIRDRAIGIVATGPMSVHQALMFRQWSPDVVFFAHDQEPPGGEDAEKLAARGIRVVAGPIARIESAEGRIDGVRMVDGELVEREALAVATRMEARGGFLADLGLKPVEHPSGMGVHVPADPMGRTAVDGVFAAGNVANPAAQVGNAAADAAMAGAIINADLIEEETAAAVAAYRAR